MQTTIQLTATVDDLLSWSPCEEWTEDRIRQIAGDRTKWTALDVLALERVPAEDRLWVVLRPELIPEPLLHELACRFAEQVLPIWERAYPDDRRPHEAIAAKRAWLQTDRDHELSAAAVAAREAATNATYAAGAAAWASECAAEAAVWAAARSARSARSARAAEAARAAAASARAAQVAIVQEQLSRPGGEGG